MDSIRDAMVKALSDEPDRKLFKSLQKQRIDPDLILSCDICGTPTSERHISVDKHENVVCLPCKNKEENSARRTSPVHKVRGQVSANS